MLTPERKDALLAHAQKSLAKWNALEPRFKGPSDRPYANTIGCEELIDLLEELNVLTGHQPSINRVTFQGQAFSLTDAELAALLPGEVVLSHMDGPGTLSIQRIPEAQRQAEIAEMLRKTDELTTKKHRGRKPGSKNKPKVPVPPTPAADEPKSLLITVKPGTYARRVKELEEQVAAEKHPDKRRELTIRLQSLRIKAEQEEAGQSTLAPSENRAFK